MRIALTEKQNQQVINNYLSYTIKILHFQTIENLELTAFFKTANNKLLLPDEHID